MISLLSVFQSILPGEIITKTWVAVSIALICIFSYFYSRSPYGGQKRLRLAAALATGLAFGGLALFAYMVMDSNYQSFNHVYSSFTNVGSLSNQAWATWHMVYGEPIIQHDLMVTQYVTTSSLVKIAPISPGNKDQYMNVQDEHALEQNSITAFTGHVTMNLVNPEHQADSYNAFALTALYEYEITNPADQPTQANFRFPLDINGRLFRNVHVLINGEELHKWQLDKADGAITWNSSMQPGQKDKIVIQYVTWGMNGFTFMVDQPREVTNFQLSLALETDNH
jgi:hypothetical protein